MGLFALLVVVSVLFRLSGRAGFARFLLSIGVLMLLAASLPKTAEWLAGRLESQYPPVSIADLPQVEVAVMLGGVLALPRAPRLRAELVGSSDRILHALRIVQQGKAKHLFVSGGNVFNGYFPDSESAYTRVLLKEWGLSDRQIDTGEISRTTWGNARETGDYLSRKGWINEPVILVTSAMHMPRAVESFRAANIRVIPASTDIQVIEDSAPSVFSWLPNAAALQLTTAAWHEMVGIWYYRWRGWAIPQ